MEQPVLELGQRLKPLGVNAPVQASLERCLRVLAEVEPVAPVDGFEQKLELQLLHVALRLRQGLRLGRSAQWYSHTRIRERS